MSAGGVFKVELPLLHRWRTFDRISHLREARGNASVFLQEPMNGAGRFRQTKLLLFQGFIATQIIEDGDADLACALALLGDHPGSLEADLPAFGSSRGSG